MTVLHPDSQHGDQVCDLGHTEGTLRGQISTRPAPDFRRSCQRPSCWNEVSVLLVWSCPAAKNSFVVTFGARELFFAALWVSLLDQGLSKFTDLIKEKLKFSLIFCVSLTQTACWAREATIYHEWSFWLFLLSTRKL